MLGIIAFHAKTKLDRQRDLNRHYHIQCKRIHLKKSLVSNSRVKIVLSLFIVIRGCQYALDIMFWNMPSQKTDKTSCVDRKS